MRGQKKDGQKKCKNRVRVDYDKFMRALAEKGLNVYDLAEEMGYTRRVLQNKATLGGLAPFDVVFLEKFKGIKPEEYVIPDEPEVVAAPEKEEPSAPAAIDVDMLTKVIYSAVYAAVKDAWEDKPPRCDVII